MSSLGLIGNVVCCCCSARSARSVRSAIVVFLVLLDDLRSGCASARCFRCRSACCSWAFSSNGRMIESRSLCQGYSTSICVCPQVPMGTSNLTRVVSVIFASLYKDDALIEARDIAKVGRKRSGSANGKYFRVKQYVRGTVRLRKSPSMEAAETLPYSSPM